MRKVLHPEAEEKKRDRLQEMKAADLEKSESEKGRTGLRTLASSFSSSFFFALCRHFQKSENAMSIALYFCFFSVSFLYHSSSFFLWTFIERKNRTDFRDKRRIRELDRDRKNFHCFFYSEVSL